MLTFFRPFLRTYLCFHLSIGLSGNVVAQDEREFRDFLMGEVRTENTVTPELSLKFRVFSPLYEFDLDGDHRNEKFLLEKRDGKDWLHIHNYKDERIFSTFFEPLGERSTIYRLNIRQLSAHTKLILIHYYEGHTDYINFHGTSRLHYLTIDNNDFKTLSIYRGPAVFEEMRERMGVVNSYHQRGYHISLNDFNESGVRDVSVRYRGIVRVYRYLGLGKWIDFGSKKGQF
jgi:hypothetical protein